MFSFEEFSSRFLAAWNTPDKDRRRDAFEDLLDPGMIYADPHLPGRLTGSEAYLGFLEAVRDRMPLIRFEARGDAAMHHGFGRIQWRLITGEGANSSDGAFICELTTDGRVKLLIGFACG